MREQNDPFSFQQLPTAEDHVNNAFAKLNLRKAEAPAFHQFLSLALKPINPVTRATLENFNIETSNRLASVINSIVLARSRCNPHFEFEQDLTETFMIVAAMPALTGNGYMHMSAMLNDPFNAQTMVEANRSFHTLRGVDAHLSKVGLERKTIPHNMYAMLSREEKLLIELRGVQLAREAVSAVHHDEDAKVLAVRFERVTRIRPIMTNDESLMVRYFRTIHQAIDDYIGTKGVPVVEPRLGDRLRQHAQGLGASAPEPVQKPAEAPVSETSNVRFVTFGRPAVKSL